MATRRIKKRKAVKPRVARTRASGTLTEAAYFGWIRSQLRSISTKWRPIYECRRKGRRRALAADKAKWGGRITFVNQCAKCQQWFPDRLLQVDHFPPCGSLGTNEEDFRREAGGWILRLLSETDSLRLLCHECHYAVTHNDI